METSERLNANPYPPPRPRRLPDLSNASPGSNHHQHIK